MLDELAWWPGSKSWVPQGLEAKRIGGGHGVEGGGGGRTRREETRAEHAWGFCGPPSIDRNPTGTHFLLEYVDSGTLRP